MLICRDVIEGRRVYYEMIEKKASDQEREIFKTLHYKKEKKGNGLCFSVAYSTNGNKEFTESVVIPQTSDLSAATLYSISYALKLLLIYNLSINKKGFAYDQIETDEMIKFFSGIDFVGYSGVEYKFSLKRNLSTVKDYFSKLITYAHIKTPYINVSKEPSSIYKHIEEIFATKPRNHLNPVKDYITPEEYNKLYKYAKENSNPCFSIILKLMYEYGLRINEILGLTIEDIELLSEQKAIILRNRSSDNKFQKAKVFIQYEIPIKGDLSKELSEHIKFVLQCVKSGNYLGNIIADIYEWLTASKNDKNYYIMLDISANKKLRLLSLNTWNRFLKEAFNTNSIAYDYTLENSLSKVIRNGFGVYHAVYADPPVDPEELRLMMRLSKVSLVNKYYQVKPVEANVKYEFESNEVERRIIKFISEKGIEATDITKTRAKTLETIDGAIQKRLNKVEELLNEIEECDVTLAKISEDTGMSKQTFYNNPIYREYIDEYKKKYEETKKKIL